MIDNKTIAERLRMIADEVELNENTIKSLEINRELSGPIEEKDAPYNWISIAEVSVKIKCYFSDEISLNYVDSKYTTNASLPVQPASVPAPDHPEDRSV